MFGAESSSFTLVTQTNPTTSSNPNSAIAQIGDDTEKKGAKGSHLQVSWVYVFGIWVLRSGDAVMLVVAVSYGFVEVA